MIYKINVKHQNIKKNCFSWFIKYNKLYVNNFKVFESIYEYFFQILFKKSNRVNCTWILLKRTSYKTVIIVIYYIIIIIYQYAYTIDHVHIPISTMYSLPLSLYAHFAGFHAGLLLQTVLDRSPVSVHQAAGRWDPIRGIGVHQEYLGARHVLRQWETVLLPHSDHQQRVHPDTPFGEHNAEHSVNVTTIIW